MLEIHATFDSHQVERLFGGMYRDQIPFASAVALTRTAVLVKAEIQKELPGMFTIRRPWTAGGIRAERAQKKDWPHCFAQVGSIDPYMVDFEEGGPHKTEGTRSTGFKTGKDTSAFVIPTGIRQAVGLSKQQVIPGKYWPKRLLKGQTVGKRGVKGSRSKPLPFEITFKSGFKGIAIRTGTYGTVDVTTNHGVSKRRREHVKALWKFMTSPSKAPRKGWLLKTSNRIVEKHLQSEFEKAMTKAMETAR